MRYVEGYAESVVYETMTEFMECVIVS